jgi:ankyrin repeat protein
LILETGEVDVKTLDKAKHDVLYYAIESFTERTDLISCLLSNGVKPYGLAYAGANKGSLPLLLMLLKTGADPNTVDRVSGSTALHVAVASGSLPMVMALLSAGAWGSVKNLKGETPLSIAVSLKKKEMVVLLNEKFN